MKHSSIKIIFSSALIFMCSTAGVAQEHVVEAYADFSKVIAADNSMITMNKTVCYRDKTTSQITGNCSVVDFRLDGNDFQYIRKIIDAMDKDRKQAYHNASGTADTQGVTYAIAYGTGENDYELIGVDNTMNFKIYCFKDKVNEDYRTSYAVEWKQDAEHFFIGRVYRIYGMKPTNTQPKSKKSVSLYRFGDDGVNFQLDSLINNSSFKKLSNLGNAFSSGNIYNNRDNDDKNASWLSDFGFLVNTYKVKAKGAPKKGVVYATELLKLCKNSDAAHLTDSEKKLCIKSLKELLSMNNDSFCNGLINEAIGYLK